MHELDDAAIVNKEQKACRSNGRLLAFVSISLSNNYFIRDLHYFMFNLFFKS